MAIQKRTLRGLQDIRTHSGKVERGNTPLYKVYMNLSCLEMEKFRRGKEREGARQRMENIDARFRDIEAEKRELLQSLNNPNRGRPRPVREAEPDPAPPWTTREFKIRY